MPRLAVASALALAAALGLAGCHRADQGATRNPNAQGSPGTGNGVVQSTPSNPESTNAQGPSGVKGSLPHTGSSGGDTVPGTTGQGAPDASGRSQTAQPGTGLAGGMGAAGAGMVPGSSGDVAGGSSNRSTRSSVGNR